MKTQITSLESKHFPVMLSEIIKISSFTDRGLIVDCTFGAGGYSEALLQSTKAKVVGFDRDKSSETKAKKLERNL